MNKKLLLALITLPAACIYASSDKPDGLLGVDYITASGSYYNVDMGDYQSGLDFDYAGIGVRLNKYITDFQGVGVDASFTYSGTTNQNNSELYTSDTSDYVLAVTLFQKDDSSFAPYLSAIVGYETTEFKDKVVNYKTDDDTMFYGLEAGVEIYLMPGLSFTPYVNYALASDDDIGSKTSVGSVLNYWFTNRLGANIDVSYSSDDHIDEFGVSGGISFHY